jgi:uncharacterized protein
MDKSEFDRMKSAVLKKLIALNPQLSYHNIDHTIDVLEQCERIAHEEGVDEDNIYLLKVAALYHDTGFLRIYTGHEKVSCEFFLEDSKDFHFTEEEKGMILGMIMATKVPQEPHTLLEKIICDADLDYLGRKDFVSISDQLRREFISFGFIASNSEWEQLQLKFLNNHQYHTLSERRIREPFKKENIKEFAYAS